MKKNFFAAFVTVFVTIIALSACKKNGSDNGNTDNFDRKALLTNYADNYVLPAYADMAQKLISAGFAADAFIAGPDQANLASLRLSVEAAYLTWQKTELLEFGPAENGSLRMFMNIYPVSASKVNANIAAGGYDLETFGNKDAQGFPALDYLLNGTGSDDASIVAWFNDNNSGPARRQYLHAVVAKMSAKLEQVRDEWTTYRNSFIEQTGTDAGSSLSQMTNAYVLYYERYLRSGKIGLPVGAMTGVSKADLVENLYKPELSKQLAVTALTAVKHFFEGISYTGATDGQGMKDYLAAIGTKDETGKLMSDLISERFDLAIGSVQQLNGTIKDAVVSNRPAVLAVYDNLQEIVPLLKVDMISAFGISITYVDNDGD